MKKLLVRSSKFIVHSLIAFFLLLLLPTTNYQLLTVHAVSNPLSVPNNKFGIHIIQATPDESSPAASLVNNNGDWGYITFLIESKDRNEGKWQEFFNDLRRRHLIPIVRLATKPVNSHWERPYEKEYQAVADFLDRLNWPTKNRYVTVYNEPNHGQEWGNQTDPASYAHVLNNTIDSLKKKSDDFFVMNAGFDASSPHQPPKYFDEALFLKEMEKAVPGIFNKLDGWVSHSYPNPGFLGSPHAQGRGTVRGYLWELNQLKNLGVTKELPVFITETGWVHTEGINYNPNYPSADAVAEYYKTAFDSAWNDPRIVAVTPFLLSYQEPPFEHFSFKKTTNSGYYPQYHIIKDMPKTAGKPVQINSGKLVKGEVYSSIVSGEVYTIYLTFKNTGQSIWGDSLSQGSSGQVKLKAIEGGKELGIEEVSVDKPVEPDQDYTFQIHLRAPEKGNYKVSLQLFSDGKKFDSKPIEFTTEVKEPVILKILTKLKWKESAAGNYILRTTGAVGDSTQAIMLDENGASAPIEARYLLPDYTFNFTLEKENYKSKTIKKKATTGENILDFGELQPSLLKNILNPKILWNLLPFSNLIENN